MSEKRFEVIIAAVAEADLEAIYNYLQENRSEESAVALLDKLQEVVNTLGTFPQRGSCPMELMDVKDSEIRQLFQWPYRIVYEVNGSIVEVFAIVDGRRDLRALLQSRRVRR
jgi:toxin ParE1/3/4